MNVEKPCLNDENDGPVKEREIFDSFKIRLIHELYHLKNVGAR